MPSTDRNDTMNDLCLIIGYDRGIVGRQAVMILESDIERLADLITLKQKEARIDEHYVMNKAYNKAHLSKSCADVIVKLTESRLSELNSPDREEDKR